MDAFSLGLYYLPLLQVSSCPLIKYNRALKSRPRARMTKFEVRDPGFSLVWLGLMKRWQRFTEA
jgi:hypothetical protein